jgi:hypothetical protein
VVALANGWSSVAGGEGEAGFLDEHLGSLEDPPVRDALTTLAELHPGQPFLARALAILEQFAVSGAAKAIAAIHHENHVMHVLQSWVSTPTWPASRELLEADRDLLLSPEIEAILEADASTDPVAAQHLGIVRLCRGHPIPDVYDAVTNTAEAADQAAEAMADGDASWLYGLLLACPHLRSQPFSGAATAGVLALLTDRLEDARRHLYAAADQGTETQRRALAGRLERLARARSELAGAISELTGLLSA